MSKDFLRSETGAVTVDWVVLTAGLVGLGLATMAVVSTGVQDTSGDIQGQLEAEDIISSSFTVAVAASYDYINADRGAVAIAWYEGELANDVQETQSHYTSNLEFLRAAIENGQQSSAQHELDYLIAAHATFGDGSNPDMDLAALAQGLQATEPNAYGDLDEAYAAYIAKFPD